MSIVPALIAIQIATNATTSRSYGSTGGYAPRTKGFRSLSERGIHLRGWRNVAYNLFVVVAIIFFLALVVATVGGGIALAAMLASAFSPWTLLATLPTAVAVDAGVVWLMLRVLLG